MNDQLILDIQLRSDWQFDNFILGENTQLLEHLKSIEESYAFYFVWGINGSGKTHLLNALCHDFQFRFPYVSLVYLPLGGEINFPPSCLEGLENCQMVCIDNIDAVLGDKEWEHALFHFLNRMKDSERVTVLSASQHLSQLKIDLPDLKSRIGAALNFELKPLKNDQAMLALKQKAVERGIKLDEEVLSYIEKRGPRNMNKLVEFLNILDAESLKEKRVITVPFLKKLVTW